MGRPLPERLNGDGPNRDVRLVKEFAPRPHGSDLLK